MAKQLLKILLYGYLGYLAITALLILPALNFLPSWFIAQQYDRELHSEIMLFNPFTLSVQARGVELPEKNGERFVGFSNAEINLSLESIWKSGVVLDKVDIDELFVHLRQLQGGGFNFDDFVSTSDDDVEPKSEGDGIPALTIHDLDFDAERILLTDEDREVPFSTHYDGLAINVRDLSTVIEEGKPYDVVATAESGGTLRWQGDISIPRGTSSGSLQLTDISLKPFWRFIEPQVAFRLTDGALNIAGQYELAWREELVFLVEQGEVNLHKLSLEPKAPESLPDTALGLQQLDITDIRVESAGQRASIGEIRLAGLAVAGWSEGEEVSLATMLAPPAEAAAGSGQTTGSTNSQPSAPQQAEEVAGEQTWTAEIATVALVAGEIRWRSEYTDPPLLSVTPIDASLENIQWPLAGDTLMNLALQVNEQAALDLSGSLDLGSGDGTIDMTLGSLPVPWFNPNLPEALKAELTDGAINVEGQLALAGFSPLTIDATGEINNFSGGIIDSSDSLTSWDTVRWEGLNVDMQKRHVVLEKLVLNQYSGRLHIYEDGSINTMSVWEEEVGDQADEVREEINEGGPWSYSLPLIMVTDSRIDFMDESLPLNFRTVIDSIHGDIKDLASDPNARASVNINGSVDDYAPVKLSGEAEPFSAPPNLDLTLVFTGMDLATLTPYSGTYAGYAIERGILNLNLEYTLEDAKIDGHNDVVIQQLKLGEKIESDQALDLPLKLGLALLTDLNGVIDLDVPVSGDMNDPEFGLGSVIIGALVNLITKAATAPFALLGALVGSEDDLQRLTFPSGSAELNDAGRNTLSQLSEALAQRPALTLVITPRLHPTADLEELRANNLDKELLAAGLSQEQLDKKKGRWEKAIKARYEQLLEQGTITAGEDKPELDAMLTVLLENTPVEDSQLTHLAVDRARTIKGFLVNDAGLEADRAVIEQISLDDEANLFSGAEMTVEI